ncbi:MAG: hypothetical protein NDJ94_11125 [Vicinamibacteria bacterium]|nr:hypothetical protein [Vicinamibacteria bacterium]
MSRARALFTAVSALTILAACGGGGGGGSSTPQNPVASATPTPAPTPTPNPFAAACGTPLPPLSASYGYRIKVQLEPRPTLKVLNASPLVRDAAYCAAAGFPGSNTCNTRLETDPQREACDHYISGISKTGRPGPDWYEVKNGQNVECSGMGRPELGAACGYKDITQYMIDISAAGKFRACSPATGQCGVCVVEPGDWGVVHDSPAGICKLDDE